MIRYYKNVRREVRVSNLKRHMNKLNWMNGGDAKVNKDEESIL